MKRLSRNILAMFALCGWWIAAESARAISLETQSNAVTSSRITIDADRSDWQGIPEYTLDTDSTPPGPELDFDAVQFANDATNVYFRLRLLPSPSGTPQPYGFRHNLFLDTDQDRTTGFVGGGNFLATGADYLVQGPAVYSFGGATPEEFTWNFLQDLGANDTPDTDIEVSIPIAVIGSPDQFDFFFNGANEGFIAEDFYPEFANSPLGDFFTYDLADVGPPPGITGDYNGNGRVEQADLDLVLLNWGQTGVPGGWFNDLPQGTIDQAELDGVLLNWGDTSAPVSAPESTSLVLLAIGCAGAWCVVRWGAIRTVGCSCREQP